MSITNIDSTGAVTNASASSASTAATADDNGSFTQSDFITLLVEELTNQDPTAPTSTSELMTELTQMQSIQASQAQTDSLTEMNDSLEAMTESFGSLSDSLDEMTGNLQDMIDGLGESMDDLTDNMNDMMDSINNTIGTMSSLLNANNNLMYAMVYDNTFQNAVGLTGSYVTGTDADGNDLQGTVTAAFMSESIIYLSLDDGTAMPYANLTGVAQDPSAFENQTADETSSESDDAADAPIAAEETDVASTGDDTTADGSSEDGQTTESAA